jgi:hypothetical protein
MTPMGGGWDDERDRKRLRGVESRTNLDQAIEPSVEWSA